MPVLATKRLWWETASSQLQTTQLTGQTLSSERQHAVSSNALGHSATRAGPQWWETPNSQWQCLSPSGQALSGERQLAVNSQIIWPIQSYAKSLKNVWNPGTWVFICENSARAIKWILTWQGLDGFQKSLCPFALDENSLSIGRVKPICLGNQVLGNTNCRFCIFNWTRP